MRYRLQVVVIMLSGLFCFNCSKPTVTPVANTPDTTGAISTNNFFVANYDIDELMISQAFDSGRVQSTVVNLALDEISGIACSYKRGNAVWVEEDSGNENKIYLLDVATGAQLASVRLPMNDRDWEDMSIAPGPVDGLNYIYLAEIGDNNYSNKIKYIYRFPEPTLTGPFPTDITYDLPVDKISFQYPDGIRNAEAVMIDPLTKDIYVLSKEGQATLYVARYPQSTTSLITLTKLGTLPISTITAADISPVGDEILVKNYDRIFYWKKKSGESITALLQEKPVRLIYVPEPKGEAICWKTDGSGFYTTSEFFDGTVPVIYEYLRKK